MYCIFCKIVKGEIPNYTVYEDEVSLAFLDINPHAKGHTVVVPKLHSDKIFDLPDENLKKLSVAVKRAMEKLQNKLNPDGFNVGWNHGEAGGQAVNHLHIHILPRYKGDSGGNIHSIIKNPGELGIEEVYNLLSR
jgi:histidine triad (HIT) family protein